MKTIDLETYERVIKDAGLKPKFRRELRPKFGLTGENWDEIEFVPITDRSGNRGILWVEIDGDAHILPFELSRGIVDKSTGRAKPVVCDLCYTQQIGTNAARITIIMPKPIGTSRGLLVCADLACSAHVRGKTMAGIKSKAQLRETISIEAKVDRLQKHLRELIASLENKV